jgi:pimeloyl-ACP methyl ester carboxylesterase
MEWEINQARAYAYTGGRVFDASLPTVVFIHGAQNDHSVWALQSRYLAHHGFGVLAVDLPGHCRSGGQALGSIEQQTAWLLQLLDAAGVQTAALIGHSMGSLIALETAFMAPERVSKLALLGTAFPMKVSDSLLDWARNDEAQAIDRVTMWMHTGIAQKPSFPGPGAWALGGNRRLNQRISQINPNQVYFSDFNACNQYQNGLLAAQSINCPALFICAQQDVMTSPKAAQGLIKAMSGAQVVKIARCGHAMMAEQPDQVLNALLAFLR